MHYTAPLTAIGVLTVTLLMAVAAQLSYPDQMLQQPIWPTDMSTMLRLQKSDVPARPELNTSFLHDHLHTHKDAHGHYRSPGKPGADVNLTSTAVRNLPLGTIETVELTLENALPPGTLQVRVETSEGLALVSSMNEWQFDTAVQKPLHLALDVQANTEGQHYVHVFVEHTDDSGVRSARALATEIRVGSGFLTKVYAKSFRASERSGIHVLPAQESIY